MKIIQLDIQSKTMKLKEPYQIAYETVDHCENLFVRAITDDGIIGYGCAAPDKEITGETAQSVEKDFNHVIWPILKNANPFRYNLHLSQIQENLNKSPAALAMADMLLFDLVAKRSGVPLYYFLGGYRKSIPTNITIGILPLNQTLSKVKEYIQNGFNIIKIKGGIDVEEDIQKIIKIRKKFAPSIEIRFDANQGYSYEEAIHFVEKTRAYHVELLEQPTPKNNYELLGKVSTEVSIPVMADESLMNLRDAFHLTSRGFTDMVNIKLMKVGGIKEAMHISSVAKSAKVESMVGCMDESGLSIAAGLHFALSRPNIIYADLDGHLDLINDPARDAVILKKGILYPTGRPGLGYDLEELFSRNCSRF